MRIALLLLAVAPLGAASAQSGGDGADQVPQSFIVGRFDRIALAGQGDVVVQAGTDRSVRVVGDEKEIDRLRIAVEEGVLRIERPLSPASASPRSLVTVYVVTPALRGAAVEGAGTMRIDRVKGEAFNGSITGSGNLEIGQLSVDRAAFAIEGSGAISAAGSAKRSQIDVNGSGLADLFGLSANSAEVFVDGPGRVRAFARESVNVLVRGPGQVKISGGAKCRIGKPRMGDISCNS